MCLIVHCPNISNITFKIKPKLFGVSATPATDCCRVWFSGSAAALPQAVEPCQQCREKHECGNRKADPAEDRDRQLHMMGIVWQVSANTVDASEGSIVAPVN